jgi:hypothetical protein
MPILDACYHRARVRINFVKLSACLASNFCDRPGPNACWFSLGRLQTRICHCTKGGTGAQSGGVHSYPRNLPRGRFALVMAVRRESWQSTPAEDQWIVYSVSTKSGDTRKLLSGYDLQTKSWFSFYSRDKQDLGITYLDCDECEPATLFTALHYDRREGWRARWANKENPDQPGITLRVTDVGDPYTDEDVDQVFAVLSPHDGIASVGTWYHSRDLATGKVTDGVSRFSVDPLTGKDRSTVLTGAEAREWELKLCKAADSSWGLAIGQSSRTCKAVLSGKRKGSK